MYVEVLKINRDREKNSTANNYRWLNVKPSMRRYGCKKLTFFNLITWPIGFLYDDGRVSRKIRQINNHYMINS